jgi:class 3 adenylate cyclase/tetratricopeptide (TPR) repeat protein
MPACARCGESNGGDAAFCRRCGARLGLGPGRTSARKVVSVLFSDVSGFTALGERLDPESLQQLMSRWFGETRRIIERHAGTVEQYMGDAVMAVFGVPVVHEDDAARAARAALEMHERLDHLNDELERRWGVRLEIHTGLNTGEVVVGSAPGGDLSTVGDVVNVAQRLEASAPPGEVLIGEDTARQLGELAELQPLDPLALKGKSLPVSASRLRSVRSERAAGPTRPSPPFVGREHELERLRQTFDRVATSQEPRMALVAGPAGIGKSRLVGALLEDVRSEATSAVGRCLPYGDGITYWPVAEIARALAGAPTEQAVASLIDPGSQRARAELIAARISRAAGFVRGTVSVEEAQWAVRKLMERIAQDGPLVVVFEDIHWAEQSLLELIDHIARGSARVPLLLVCLMRPEFFEAHPSWAAAGSPAIRIDLEPLSQRDANALFEGLPAGSGLTSTERDRVLAAAEGNPFFLQQMAAMRAELGAAADAIPPTIQAVLTSRIDRLPESERAVLEAAAVEGRTFHRGALAELVAARHHDRLDAALGSLVHRGLIGPGRSEFANEAGYRFDHILIRDATYSLVPKRVRADLHERHATWLEQRSDYELGEHEEVIGYHLEQALRCRLELEPAARERHRDLAARGADHLGAAGRAALARDDTPAAINLLERATALLPDDDRFRGSLLPELGSALMEAGRLAEAEQVLDAAVEAAAGRDDALALAHATVARVFLRLQVSTEDGTREVQERFDPLLATFTTAGDDLGLGRLWRVRALVHWIEGRSASADQAWERAAEHARQAGDERGWSETLSWLASSAHAGPLPVDPAIERCESIRSQLGDHRRAQALVLGHLAAIRAMKGEIAATRRLIADRKAILSELGISIHTAVSHDEAFVALASGDAASAEATLRTGYERLVEMGEKALLADTAAMLAQVLCQQGRAEEAWAFTREAENAASEDDLSAQVVWRGVRARLLARAGRIGEAKRLSAHAVELAGRTDWLTDHADALIAHAEVLRLAGEAEEVARAIQKAIVLYDRKGNMVGIRRARSLLAAQVPA